MTGAEAIDGRGMTRGGRRKERDAPERRCIVTGESAPAAGLVRFALSPEGEVVPDLAGRLPGRGAWVAAERGAIERAVAKRLFARAFRRPVAVPDDLADRVERGLTRRLIETLALARKAGQAVTGAEKVRARIAEGRVGALVQAHDGAADGRAKLARLAEAAGKGAIARIEVLDSAEMGLAFGREFAIHAALDAGGIARRACAEAIRLTGLRPARQPGTNTEEGPRRGGTGADPVVPGPEGGRGLHRGAPDRND